MDRSFPGDGCGDEGYSSQTEQRHRDLQGPVRKRGHRLPGCRQAQVQGGRGLRSSFQELGVGVQAEDKVFAVASRKEGLVLAMGPTDCQ